MNLKNHMLPALILSLTALSACTQVPPPKAASLQQKQGDPAKVLTELTYGKLELKQDVEGSKGISIEADKDDTLKLTVYDSCDPTKVLLTEAMKAGDKNELFEGVMGILSGKTGVKGVDPATAGIEHANSTHLVLTEIQGGKQKIYVAPAITGDPTLIEDLEKFVEEKVAAAKPTDTGLTDTGLTDTKAGEQSATDSGATPAPGAAPGTESTPAAANSTASSSEAVSQQS